MLNSEVKVSYLSKEELMKARIGAKCDLEDKTGAKRSQRGFKWRSAQATAASAQNKSTRKRRR